MRCTTLSTTCSTSGRIRTVSSWVSRGIRIEQRKRCLPRTQASEDSESSNVAEAWERLLLTKRKMQIAAKEEDYALAASLRDEAQALSQTLPFNTQVIIQSLDVLKCGATVENYQALRTLAQLGDMNALSYLAPYLHDPLLQSVVYQTMWSIFMRAPSYEIETLMHEACRLMESPRDLKKAMEVFTEIIQKAPSYAEGWNKRATVEYHMGRFKESIVDCEMTLQLNPYHFGALSGMGLCYMELARYSAAVRCLERALQLHPNLPEIRRVLEMLRAKVADSNTEEGEGIGGGEAV